MAVQVLTTAIEGGLKIKENHPRGTDFQVVDHGHLMVLGDGKTTPVAVYSPGSWVSARVLEDEPTA
jgi:hypothetical protein